MSRQLKHKPPHRPIEHMSNTANEPNDIFRPIVHELRGHFREIDHDHSLLRAAYVTERQQPRANTTGRHSDRNVDNMVVEWSDELSRFVPSTVLTETMTLLENAVPDRAERYLLNYLLLLSARVLESACPCGGRPTDPTRRLFFIQGGIGRGKSTMLRHLRWVLLPDLRKSLPVVFLPILFDFNLPAKGSPSEEVWRLVLRQACDEVMAHMSALGLKEHWQTVSAPFLHTSDGDWIEPIRIHDGEDRKKAIKEFVAECAKPEVFLERAAIFLARQNVPTCLVFVLDNLDWQLPVERQISFVDRLKELFIRVFAIGVVAVREYTLGNMSSYSSLRGFVTFPFLHMTTPKISKIIQKRISLILDKITPQRYPSEKIAKIASRARDLESTVKITLETIREVLSVTHMAFEDRRRAPAGHSLPELLHGSSNGNTRLSLDLALTALESWALDVDSAIVHHLYERDRHERDKPKNPHDKHKKQDISPPPLTFDELLRLGMVGKRPYYATDDQDRHEIFFNVYGWGRKAPKHGSGQFPHLIKSRLMQFIDQSGGRIQVKDIINAFAIFEGYRSRFLTLLEQMIDQQFLESDEGDDLHKVQYVHGTHKLSYYLRILSKHLVYLENVRNDCIIEYEAIPHECRDDLVHDLREVLHFILYIFDQEKEEYRYVKDREVQLGNGDVRISYLRMLEGKPLCLTLLDSVVERTEHLWKKVGGLVYEADKAAAMLADLERDLRDDIVQAINNDELPRPREVIKKDSALERLLTS